MVGIGILFLIIFLVWANNLKPSEASRARNEHRNVFRKRYGYNPSSYKLNEFMRQGY